MADFSIGQAAIAGARAALDEAEAASVQAAARAHQAQAALDAALRQRRGQHEGADDGAIARLEASARKAAAERDAARTRLASAKASLSAAGARFVDFTDPRQNVGRLSDTSPFLLFPVRVETRFKIVGGPQPEVAAQRHQLWVRIFPDDCSVD